MAQNKFKGLGIALITPFKSDGEVDYEALTRLVEYQIRNGVDFLCIMGTTAETPCLSADEKKILKKMLVERVAGRVPLLMGCGGNNTAAVVKDLKEGDWSGIDGILSVCPYYNKPSQEGIYQHYKAISEATDLPIVLYNVPGRTGVHMSAETTLRLARDFENIVAVKEASGNMTQLEDVIKNKPRDFDVLSGDDGITYPLITMGAVDRRDFSDRQCLARRIQPYGPHGTERRLRACPYHSPQVLGFVQIVVCGWQSGRRKSHAPCHGND